MKYTVTWTPSAEARLADLWVKAKDQRAFTDAANQIDRLLKHDPQKHCLAWKRLFVLNEDPLVVLVEIDEGDRMVRVLEVKVTRG